MPTVLVSGSVLDEPKCIAADTPADAARMLGLEMAGLVCTVDGKPAEMGAALAEGQALGFTASSQVEGA